MATPNPKNIVHVSTDDISNSRIKHVKESEILDIDNCKKQLGTISFENAEIVNDGTATGTFLTFTFNGQTYAIPLYTV